jgi:hypothetical protein
MKNHKAHITAVFLCWALFSLHLDAAVYTYNATIDPSAPSTVNLAPGGWEYSWHLSGAPSFTVLPGDTVQGTISFAGNQALQFLGPVGPVTVADIELTLIDRFNVGQIRNNSTTTLNGVTGLLAELNPTTAAGSGGADQLIAALGIISTPTSISFTGFSYSTTVISGGGHYTPDAIHAYNPNNAPGAISAVPEPSVAGLTGTGAVLIILLRRLKRA